MGVTMVLAGVTRANGATLIPLLIMVVAYLPGRIGAAYALQPWLGSDAMWWSFSLAARFRLR